MKPFFVKNVLFNRKKLFLKGEPMRKIRIVFCVFLLLLFSGCSVIEDVTSSLEYVNNTTSYINELNEFANELPQLTENAIANVTSIQELENRLIDVTNEIETFIQLEAPTLAEDIHGQLVDYSEQLKVGIEDYLATLEIGVLELSQIKSTEILQTISNLTSLLNQLEQLVLN
jgi:hypothetical protein